MIKKNIQVFLIIYFILILQSTQPQVIQTETEDFSQNRNKINTYNKVTILDQQNSPININGNDEIEVYSKNGSGSFTNPYIISDYSINDCNIGKVGVSIQNTDKYIKLANITVNNCMMGFFIYNVSNISIRNNYVLNNIGTGFYFNSVLNSEISSNVANNNSVTGYSISVCSGNSFFNNTAILTDGYGFFLRDSWNNTLTYNYALYNKMENYYLTNSDKNYLQDNIGYTTNVVTSTVQSSSASDNSSGIWISIVVIIGFFGISKVFLFRTIYKNRASPSNKAKNNSTTKQSTTSNTSNKSDELDYVRCFTCGGIIMYEDNFCQNCGEKVR